MNTQLVHDIRQALANNANPDKAEGMRAYMKSEMPYRGVQKPARSKLVSEVLRTNSLSDKQAWQGTVLDLWRNAEYREERYVPWISRERRSTGPFVPSTPCPCSKRLS